MYKLKVLIIGAYLSIASSLMASPLGPQKTLVVTVNQPGLTEFARQTVFDWLTAFVDATSNHRASLVGIQHPTTGDAVDITLALSPTQCNATQAVATQVDTAVAALGYTPAAYAKVLILIQDGHCGNINGWTISSRTMFFISWFDRGLAAHELGHSFGAQHSDTLFCGAVPLLPNPLANCYNYSQQNPFDPMGKGQADYSAWWKHVIWGDPIPTITQDGDYTLYPLDDGVLSAAEGLQIPLVSGASLVLEYRPSQDGGVAIHWLDTTTTVGHLSLIDMTPGENYYGNAGLPLGQTWVEPVTGLTIQHLSSTGQQVTVRITGTANTLRPLTMTSPPVFATSSDGNPVAVNYALPVLTGGTPPYVGPTCSPLPGSLFPVGVTQVFCQATDTGFHPVLQQTFPLTVTTVIAPPVNCVVGSWSVVSTSVTDTNAVTNGNVQTRTETTVTQQQRPILTQPANGGTACPVN